MTYWSNLIMDFCVALGIVIGGALCGGIAALWAGQQPMATMDRLASQLKIWALVATLGGAMDTLRKFEAGVLERQITPIGKQFTYLVAAFVGAHLGYLVVHWMTGDGGAGR